VRSITLRFCRALVVKVVVESALCGTSIVGRAGQHTTLVATSVGNLFRVFRRDAQQGEAVVFIHSHNHVRKHGLRTLRAISMTSVSGWNTMRGDYAQSDEAQPS